MALFIADKLAWDQEGTPPFYDDVKSALNESLEKACYVYMSFMIDNKKVLYPHTNWILGYESIKKEEGEMGTLIAANSMLIPTLNQTMAITLPVRELSNVKNG